MILKKQLVLPHGNGIDKKVTGCQNSFTFYLYVERYKITVPLAFFGTWKGPVL